MIVGEIIAARTVEKTYIQQKDLYDHLSKKNKFFYIINCQNLIKREKIKSSNFIKNKKIIIYNPKTYLDLNSFLSKNKIFLINNLSPKLFHLKIHLMLNKKNIFQVSIDNLGVLSSYYTDNWKNINLVKKVEFLYIKKFAFALYRSLILFGLIKSIDILYLARKDVFQKYTSSILRKLPFKKRYKKIIPTKVRQISLNKKKLAEKFIIYIDPNINHGDMKTRGGGITEKSKKIFINNLKNYFTHFEKLFNKKVIICLHPSSNELLYKNMFKAFKVVKYQTEKYLFKSFVVLFHESSITNLAILMKKKLINLRTRNLGKYFYERSKLFSKNFALVKYDLDKIIKNDDKTVISKLNLNVKNYNRSLNKLYFISKKTNSVNDQIIQEIDLFKEKFISFK